MVSIHGCSDKRSVFRQGLKKFSLGLLPCQSAQFDSDCRSDTDVLRPPTELFAGYRLCGSNTLTDHAHSYAPIRAGSLKVELSVLHTSKGDIRQ